MKKYLFVIASISFASISKAQMSKEDSTRNAGLHNALSLLSTSLDSINTVLHHQLTIDDSGILSPFVYNKFLENKFTYLSFDRNVLSDVNSAALDLLENSTQLKLSIARKFSNKSAQIRSLLSAGVKAKLGDGISELFKGSSATTGTTLFLNFAHFEEQRFKTPITGFLNGHSAKKPALVKMDAALYKYYADFYDKYVEGFTEKYNLLIDRYSEIKRRIKDGKIDTACCKELAAEKIQRR